MDSRLVFSTADGDMYQGDSLSFMRATPEDSVNLVVTSPPSIRYSCRNSIRIDEERYVSWFLPFAQEIRRILTREGSLILHLGGKWMPERPTRSLYHHRVLLALCDQLDYRLAQEFFHFSTSDGGRSVQWERTHQVRARDRVDHVFWLSPSDTPKAKNTNVLLPDGEETKERFKQYFLSQEATQSRTQQGSLAAGTSHAVRGTVPPNLIYGSELEMSSYYARECRRRGEQVHPERFPIELPRFFIEFLTEPADLILDPFAGSNTTGAAAEELGRRWVAIEIDGNYAKSSRLRFPEPI